MENSEKLGKVKMAMMMMMMMMMPGTNTYGTNTYRYSFRRYSVRTPFDWLWSSSRWLCSHFDPFVDDYQDYFDLSGTMVLAGIATTAAYKYLYILIFYI